MTQAARPALPIDALRELALLVEVRECLVELGLDYCEPVVGGVGSGLDYEVHDLAADVVDVDGLALAGLATSRVFERAEDDVSQ
jgi:hypothetical protein